MTMKDRRINVEYQLPNLCANCAAKPAELNWRISQADKIDSKTSFSITGRFKTTDTYRDLSFRVGVCKDCEKELKQEGVINGVVIGVGCAPVILGGIGLVAALGSTAFTGVPRTVFIAIMAAGIIFYFAAAKLVGKDDLAFRSIDGKKFTFRNKKYEAAFAKLNPKLVSRKYSEPAA
ncbi:MAG: hypothetical protein H0X30_25945 [Anaerolineae bacterium]|nr:hypothetical protein [Anaerolineae bacterium]